MSAPAIAETWSYPLGFDRRRAGVLRHRTYTELAERVRRERPAFLAAHGGRIPTWCAPDGVRTVYPKVRKV